MTIGSRTNESAFTLLEVMIAMAIFFIAIFSILDLTSQNVAAARRLQTMQLDPSGLASAISLTNRLEEGDIPQDIIAQFQEQHPGYTCTGNITEVSSNGLFQIDFEIGGVKDKKVVGSGLSILLFRPDSASSLRNKIRR